MDETAQVAEIHRLLHFPRTAAIDVLEAGGGSTSYMELPAGAKITCIDISREQLERNRYAHEKLLGDLQTFHYGERRFDLIVCWNVLEHLDDPKAAVDRFIRIVKPGGRIVIGGPIVTSAKGLITKFSPHALHVWFHRHILGRKNAGKPGHAPFPAPMRLFADPSRLERYFKEAGLRAGYVSRYQSSHLGAFSRRMPWASRIFAVAGRVVEAATGGRFGGADTDFCLVMHKPE